jgi:hypothetical protein
MKIICIIFVSFACILHSEVFVIDDINDIYPFIDNKTIVLFDLDDVIITPEVLWVWNDVFLKEQLNWSDDYLKYDKNILFLFKIRFPPRYKFVDKSFKDLFIKIKQKAMFVGGLTARENRDPGLWIFLSREELFFNLPCFNNNIRNGIIFCGYRDKGKTLFSVLKEKVENIVFIDDKLENCLSVFNVCSDKNIKCSSFHYTKSAPVFDINISKFQYSYFISTGLIISDDEAREMIND